MEVLLRVSRAGLNFCQEKGDKIEVEADEAGRMFAAGQCSFVDPADKAIALAAAGVDDPSKPRPMVMETTAVGPVLPGSSAATDDDEDTDAINGTGLDEAKPTAIEKAKAKKAAEKKDKAA